MEFFRIRKDIPFMRHALMFNIISLVTFLLAVFFLATKGLHLGVEFTGGTVMELHYPQAANVPAVRKALEEIGMADATVQNFGDAQTIAVRLPVRADMAEDKIAERAMAALVKQEPGVKELRRDFVGSQVGKELLDNGSLALVLVSVLIVLYLAFRFEWKFGVAAIIANLHDVVIILGFFALFQWEFSLPVLAAVLAVLGYSVNESVVVFDRIRENFRKMRRASVEEVINNAITSTMSRTIITHGSTQIMVTMILLKGGDTLHYFALALTIGILFGIYSSVLVASPIVMWLRVSREDLVKIDKPKQEAVV